MLNQDAAVRQDCETNPAWQLLIADLKINPGNRLAVDQCADILIRFSSLKDLLKLYENYLMIHPNDHEINEKKIQVVNQLSQPKPTEENDEIIQRRLKLKSIGYNHNSQLSDHQHLSACMKWLKRAQKVHDGGGVSAIYHMDTRKWIVDYPETTGYIIPTFISYYNYTGNSSYRDNAIAMGEWEIDIQAPDGGIGEPIGVYGLSPRIFNTSQVVLGWISLYEETSSEKYLLAAKKASDWLVTHQDSDGKWTNNTCMGPKSYHIRVAWVLLSLSLITNEGRYRVAAERSINWVLKQAHSNGWFDNNSLKEEGKPWTHLIGYVLVGLLKIYHLGHDQFDCKQILGYLQNASDNISRCYLENTENSPNGCFRTLSATFDRNWESTDDWSCLTGNAQIAFFLHAMQGVRINTTINSVADLLINDLKQLHCLTDVEDPNTYGGLAGSYPIQASYCRYAIPNWGVKFFADCLLQRICHENTTVYLG